MKVFLRLAVLAVLMTAAVSIWQKYRPAPPPPRVVAAPVPPPAPVEQPDLSPRIWSDLNGRTFEGALVSAKNGDVVIRRVSDSAYFQISSKVLSVGDQAFISEQVLRVAKNGGSFVEQVPDHYTVSRKLDIKGYVQRVASPTSLGGWRTDRFDPMFWFLLSQKLHGSDSGSMWVCVDEKTFNAHNEGGLVNPQNLINFSNGKGGFYDSLPWPRPQITIIYAKYGPLAKGINVTEKLLRLTANGRLPIEIQPVIFDLPAHLPESWDLTVAWRTATGEISRTLRDGSVLTWP